MKKRILAVILTLALLVGIVVTPSTVMASVTPDVLMCFLLDSSGSIGTTEWNIMLDGLKAAVNDPLVMPRDGSLEICIVQFGSTAKEEMVPTIVTDASVPGIIAEINAIVKDNGLTAMGDGILQSVTTMQKSAYFNDPDVWKVINMATDGEPNVYPGGYNGRTWVEKNVTDAVTAGVDEIDVEGIGTFTSQNDWMALSVCVPDGVGNNSGWIVTDAAPAYPPRPPDPNFMGFLRVCNDFNDYADAVNQKLIVILKGQLSLSPKTATNDVNTQHCVTATLLDGLLQPVPGATINFVVTGVNPTSGTGSSPTDSDGQATFCYTGNNVGQDTITASCLDPADPSKTLTADAAKEWIIGQPSPTPIVVGGDIYPVSKVGMLLPMIASAIILMAGTAILVWRRKVQS